MRFPIIMGIIPNHYGSYSPSLRGNHSEQKRFHALRGITHNVRNTYPQCYELCSHHSERYQGLVVYLVPTVGNNNGAGQATAICSPLPDTPISNPAL